VFSLNPREEVVKRMGQNYPKKNITFSPQALSAIEAYAKERGIGRSTAISELILFVVLGPEDSPTNPKVIERSALKVRESLSGEGLA
jgi:hypothetical protein